MDQLEVEGLIKDLNTRTKRIEQILPTLATREDLKALATKDDLKVLATKDELKALATKDELKAFPTRDEVKLLIEEEGKRTRRHFDVVAEGIKESVTVIADGHKALDDRISNASRESNSGLAKHERRITKLESNRSRRR